MDKGKKKNLKRLLSWVFVKVSISVGNFLPLRWGYLAGSLLGAIAYAGLGRHRRAALSNLALVFPNSSVKEREKISRDCFVFMAQESFGVLYFLNHISELKNVRVEGMGHLEKALKKGKGAIILTAHLGNFPLLALKLAKAGLTVNLLIRPMRNQRVDRYLYELRERARVKTITSYPRKECIVKIIRALRDNEAVIMLMDQNFGTGGVWVKFFGKLAATPVGPIILGLRTNAAIVPVYTYRESKGKHCVKIFPEERLTIAEDGDETILLNAIKFTRIIECWIRAAVCQWVWMHRRWKSQPSEKVKASKFKIE